jgi:hypothetical protein
VARSLRLASGLQQRGDEARGCPGAGRLAIGHGEHVPSRARQRGGDHAGVPGGPEAQAGERRDAESGGHERLNSQVVVGGERDLRGEAG